MPTVITKIVDPAGGAGVDFTTLTLWESTGPDPFGGFDLVGNDLIYRALCSSSNGAAFNEALTVGGWFTDDTHYLIIEGNQPLSGAWDATKARIVNATSANAGVITLGPTSFHIWLKHFQVELTSQPTRSGIRINTPTGGQQAWLRVEGCVIRCTATNPESCYGIYHRRTERVLYVWNSLFYGWYKATGVVNPNRGINIELQQCIDYLFNNTFVDCNEGVFNGTNGSCHLKNCLCYNAPFTLSGFGTAWASDSTNNSQEGFTPGSNPSDGSNAGMFVNYAGKNFALALTDTVARWHGADLSADADLAVADDIFGTPRSVPWDIGIHETANPAVGPHVAVLCDYDPRAPGLVTYTPTQQGLVSYTPEVDMATDYDPRLQVLADYDPKTEAQVNYAPRLVVQTDYDPKLEAVEVDAQ